MRTGGDSLKLLEFLGLKKREPVVCAECKYHEVKTREYMTLEKTHYIHEHVCTVKKVESIDFYTGKKTKIDVSCSSFNLNGNCRHFVKAEWAKSD